MKKFAVLFFGMPRFYEQNIYSIKSHFNLDSFEVDYFCHLWDKLGYIPIDDVSNDLIKVKIPYLHYRMIKHLNIKNINVDSYSNLEKLCDSYPQIFHQRDNFKHTGYYDSCINSENPRQWLYTLGQQYSSQEVSKLAINSKEEYDFFILTRTDLFFKPYSKDIELFYKCIERFFRRNTDKPTLMVYNINGIDRSTFDICLDKKDINSPSTYNEYIKFNDWFIVCNKLGLEKIFKNRVKNFNFLLSKYAVDSISYDVTTIEYKNFEKTFSPQFFLGEACKLFNINLVDLGNHTKGSLPCIKIVNKDVNKQKLSDRNSSKRIFSDTYINMLEQYNNIL